MAYVGNSPTQQSFTGGVDQYNGNNSNTVFGLTRTINTVYDVDAYVENVWQRPTTGYTVSANTITFTSAPPAGSNNVVVVYRNFSATSIVPQQGSVTHTAFAANAIPTALGYVPANKAGDTFSGAVSGITTLAAGNTTITGTLTASANVNLDSGTFFVDGTNNRVGINNAAPTSALTVTGNTAIAGVLNVVTNNTHPGGSTFDSTGTTQLWVRDTDAATNAKNWGIQVSGGDFNVVRANDDKASGFATPFFMANGAPDSALSISSTGLVTLGQGQLKFPATQNASADANTLDDYEEGSFTPTFVATGGTPPSSQTGTGAYVKVGRVVHLHGQINWSGSGSGGSTLYVSLPFIVVSGARGALALGIISGYNWPAGHQLTLLPELNTTVAYFVSKDPAGGGHVHRTYSDISTTGSYLFSFAGSYVTSN